MLSEQKLFIHIALQQLEDLVSTTVDPEEPFAKELAESWFRGNSFDYKTVCSFAGIDSIKLRKVALTADKVKIKKVINEYRKFM